MNFLFRDSRSQQKLWLAAALFDPRGEATLPDTVHLDTWEGGTRLPILYSALNHQSQWLHPSPDSAFFTDKPFADYGKFSVRVTLDELRAVHLAMKKAMPKLANASEDPRDYQLIYFNINPEVHAPQGSRAAWFVIERYSCRIAGEVIRSSIVALVYKDEFVHGSSKTQGRVEISSCMSSAARRCLMRGAACPA